MTVASSTDRSTFLGNGTTTIFSLPFRFFANSEIQAYLVTNATGALTLLTLGTHYTLIGAGDPEVAGNPTSKLTMITAPTALQSVFVLRVIPATQPTDIVNQGRFFPEIHENVFDRLTMLIQQANGESKGAIRVAIGDPEPARLPNATARANLLLSFDSSGNPIAIAPGSGSATDLALNLANTTDVTKGASLVGYKSRTVRAKLNEILVTSDSPGNTLADGSDQTVGVQATLNALGVNGGVVKIPPGTKFNIKNLTFPARSNLEYYVDSDLSSPSPGGDIASNELVYFSANSSYPADPTGAAVNEWRHTAPFHPGLILDVRSDIAGHDSFLKPGQSRTDPVRASVLIHQEQTDRFMSVYEKYADYSNFSGYSMHGWRAVVTLNGIGTAQWASVPAVNTTITGTTSGAKGFVIAVAAGNTTVIWSSGKFVAGETVSDNNETTSATITSVAFSLTSFQPLAQDIVKGNWSIGLPYGSTRDLFSVGGKITTAKTRTFSQYVDETINNPAFCLIDAYEGTTNGYEITYDTTPAAVNRRLTLRRYDETTNRGMIGGITAKVTFSNSALIETSAYNIASLVRTAVGKYTVTIADDMATADYAICIGNSSISDRSIWANRVAGSFEVWNYNSSAVLTDLASEVSVVCSCGDI